MSLAAEAIVVGAGPAGSLMALRLARAGRRVLLVDGARFPRPKVCGEGLLPAGVAELEALGLGHVVAGAQPLAGIRYRLPDGEAAQADFTPPARAFGVPRSCLDASLLEAAAAEPNVEVQLGRWVREVRVGDGRAPGAVRTDEGWWSAPLVVGADGCRSSVRRLVGLDAPPPARERFGVGLHLAHAPDSHVEVRVGQPGHELYLTPLGAGQTGVAVLTDRAGLAPLQGRLEAGVRDLLGRGPEQGLAQAPALGPARALGPLGLQAKAAHAPGLLLVGDAAGALDPISGEGVALAIVTSRIAAEVALEALAAGDLRARRLRRWTRERRAAIRGLSALTGLLLALSREPGRARGAVRALARSPETFQRLLAVAAGQAGLGSLRLRDGLTLVRGVTGAALAG